MPESLYEGSPPRMRGKGDAHVIRDRAHGITPAYAGKRKSRRSKHLRKKDHPRVCGEKVLTRLFGLSWGESPPRMRGKVRGHHDLRLQPGIIPAYAGKSLRSLIVAPVILGSSPRMRGKVNANNWQFSCTRITPAYAGKRLHQRGLLASVGDHPRVCGEKHTGV